MVLRMVTSAAEASSQCSNSKPVRWSGVLGTGQSLSCGHAAPLWKPTEPILSALMLDDAADDVKTPRFDIRYPDSSTLRAVPLREPMHIVKRFVRGYPRNIAGKTPHSAMAAQISTMLAEKGESLTTVHSCVGIGGQPMSVINKSGSSNAYEASMYEARALTRLAREANSKLEYDAIIFTHGETDAIFGNPGYGHALIAFHKDYIADLKSITDQKHDPVLILSQQSTCPTDPREIKPCLVTQAEWRVQAVSKNAIICGLPKYQFGYSPDSLHFTAPGYDRLGEKYGQVFYQTVLEKKPFVPLSPQHVAFSSPKTIVVSFNVSSPPLQWDEILWWPHQDMHKQWSLGRGFEVSDAEGKPLNIDSVSLIPKTNSVSIVLGSEPSRLPLTLTYAMVQDAWNTRGGRAGGRVGHLCDSDPLVGASAEWINVEANNGEKTIKCASSDGFIDRAKFDLVTPGDYTIIDFDQPRNPECVTLDRPWEGTTGLHRLFMQHNHRNYCVAFAAYINKKSFAFQPLPS